MNLQAQHQRPRHRRARRPRHRRHSSRRRSAFIKVSAEPASLSPEWYAILRDDLGFDGVAVIDDLGMLRSSGEPAYIDPIADAVIAIAAGADMVLLVAGSTSDTATQALSAIAQRATTNPDFATRLAEAASRVVRLGDALRE